MTKEHKSFENEHDNSRWRDSETRPDSAIHVLFIEGYCQFSWMEAHIRRDGFHGHAFVTKFVWVADPSYLNPEAPPPDLIGPDKAIQEMESGFYHGIVVLDQTRPFKRWKVASIMELLLWITPIMNKHKNLKVPLGCICKICAKWRRRGVSKHARVDPRQVIRNDLDALGLLPN
jgi:hypothetical protein